MAARNLIVDPVGVSRLLKRWGVVDSGGTTRMLKRAFQIDSGGTGRLTFQALAAFLRPMAAGGIFGSGTVSAQISVGTSGVVLEADSVNGTTGSFNWLVSGTNSEFEIQLVKDAGSGTVTGSSLGTWHNGATGLVATLSRDTDGYSDWYGTMTIRAAAGGAQLAQNSVFLDVTRGIPP